METIELFWIAQKGNNFSYEKIAEKWLQCGYIIDKECSTKEVYDYLCSIDINTNTTFYSTWEDVKSKDRLELFIDQVLHYMSTYWTDYEWKPYIPNNQDFPEVNFKEFKQIKSTTQEEIIDKCDWLLKSWIALNEGTINDLFKIYDRYYYIPDIDIVKNKEAKMELCLRKNILPRENEEMIRYLIYIMTQRTLLIKDNDILEAIEESNIDVSKYISKYWENKLAEVFYRFKPILLAIKKAHKNNRKIINRLRRLAVKNHKPYQKTFWEDILNNSDKIELVPEKINELNNFKKISLIEAIRDRKSKSQYNHYIIRNWKYFIKEKKENKTYPLLEKIIYQSLVDHIRNKYQWKTFYIPEYLDLTLPRSEKTFIGNVPIWTQIKLPTDDLVIGINWKWKDWTQDFDLSFLDRYWKKIWWDSSYYNNEQSIVYSWDMTSANPEATELLYFNNNSLDWMVNINRYSWKSWSKYTLFIAKEDCKNCGKWYMVKKKNILFQTELISNKKESICGIKKWNNFILQNIISSNKKVSDWNTIWLAYLNVIDHKDQLKLRQLLLDAWLKEQKWWDLDFTDIKKDDIISLLKSDLYTY